MAFQITARHLDVPDGEKGYIEKKLVRINRHFERVDDVSVTLVAEKIEQVVEINFSAGNIHLFTKGCDPNLRAAIDKAVDKLEGQITRAKNRRNGKKKHGPRKEQIVEEPEE